MVNHILTAKQRSKNMSHIRSVDTKPELILRKELWNKGVRYRKNFKKLPGKPDIAIMKHHIAIFVDGEFWHGYKWEEKQNNIHTHRSYWIPKIEKNMKRDVTVNSELESLGWKVVRFWSKEVIKNPDYCTELILFYMRDFQ